MSSADAEVSALQTYHCRSLNQRIELGDYSQVAALDRVLTRLALTEEDQLEKVRPCRSLLQDSPLLMLG